MSLSAAVAQSLVSGFNMAGQSLRYLVLVFALVLSLLGKAQVRRPHDLPWQVMHRLQRPLPSMSSSTHLLKFFHAASRLTTLHCTWAAVQGQNQTEQVKTFCSGRTAGRYADTTAEAPYCSTTVIECNGQGDGWILTDSMQAFSMPNTGIIVPAVWNDFTKQPTAPGSLGTFNCKCSELFDDVDSATACTVCMAIQATGLCDPSQLTRCAKQLHSPLQGATLVAATGRSACCPPPVPSPRQSLHHLSEGLLGTLHPFRQSSDTCALPSCLPLGSKPTYWLLPPTLLCISSPHSPHSTD